MLQQGALYQDNEHSTTDMIVLHCLSSGVNRKECDERDEREKCSEQERSTSVVHCLTQILQ